jgi:hypothetical protein
MEDVKKEVAEKKPRPEKMDELKWLRVQKKVSALQLAQTQLNNAMNLMQLLQTMIPRMEQESKMAQMGLAMEYRVQDINDIQVDGDTWAIKYLKPEPPEPPKPVEPPKTDAPKPDSKVVDLPIKK